MTVRNTLVVLGNPENVPDLKEYILRNIDKEVLMDCRNCNKACDKRVNNKIENPLAHYREEFAKADPVALAGKCGLAYADGKFSVKFLNRDLTIDWPCLTGAYSDGTPVADYLLILLGRYILEGTAAQAGGKFYSYAEIPWGAVYETQFRGRCISRLAHTYGHDLSAFAKACESVGGVAAKGGDASYLLEMLPGLTLQLIIWEADEEFPPSAQILFSDNFVVAFTAEDLAVVGDVVLNAMKGRW